ncbi:MAG: hypothetical protein HYV08_14770 [Deltaproteobacteria bacterium]|nr:hypothetical protein [Deltaproteobacteria bacterium]
MRRWFLAQVQRLWPVAGGSLSLRKSPCIRPRCAACATGEQHASYVLYGHRAGRRFARYVPDELARELEQALANGRTLQALILDAGERYLRARKAQRRP